jgi:2-dehydropantoate 2-reductase
MRICIVGAGAIGGYLGAKLAQAGADLTLIARGAHLEAIRRDGLAVEYADGARDLVRPALATDDMTAAGPQDYVVVAVKAQGLSALAGPMRALYGPETAVVYAQNGIPWWYFLRYGGEHEGRRIEAVDPGGAIAAQTEIERVIGCVVYPAATLSGPGVIRHIEGNRFTLGEPDGTKSERAQRLSQLLGSVGLRAPVRPDIRNELWLKLWGNLSFNPISALTRATLDQIIAEPLTYALAAAMMAEAQQVAERLGVRFAVSIERRIKMAEEIGAHKTSMLQDIEAGRTTEVDALVGAVAELGRLTGVPTPHIDAVYASVKLLERVVVEG